MLYERIDRLLTRPMLAARIESRRQPLRAGSVSPIVSRVEEPSVLTSRVNRSVHSSHYSDSARTRDPADPQEAERRRRDADREFERNRDRERERDRSRERRYRGDDRSDRRRRGADYPPEDDERDHPRAHKRRRSSSRDDPRSSRHYDDYYYDDRGHRDGGGRRDHRGRDRDYDRRPSRREPSYEPCVAVQTLLKKSDQY